MQDHRFDFVIDGTPEEVWDVIWARTRSGIETDAVKIEIYHQGDEQGNGLVRHCCFPVPKYLLSGGPAVGVDHRGPAPAVVAVRRHR